MTLIANKDPKLIFWPFTRFVIMPSTGDVILWGKSSTGSSPKLHVYNNTATELKKRWTLDGFCEHIDDVTFLPVKVKYQEHLAIACIFCCKIKLYNDTTSQIITAFDDTEYFPTYLCPGEGVKIYAVHNKTDLKPIIELSCTQPRFTVNKVIKTGIDNISAITHVPRKNFLVTANSKTGGVRAISKANEHHVWAKTYTWNQIQCKPNDVLYIEERDLLLISDGGNRRIVAVNLDNGSFRNVVDLDASIIGFVGKMRWHQNQLALSHNLSGQTYVAYYSLD